MRHALRGNTKVSDAPPMYRGRRSYQRCVVFLGSSAVCTSTPLATVRPCSARKVGVHQERTKDISAVSFTGDAVPAFSLQPFKGSPARDPGLRVNLPTSTRAFKRQIATP